MHCLHALHMQQAGWPRLHKCTSGVESRTRGQGHKKNEAKDRNARGQSQGPRTQAQVF